MKRGHSNVRAEKTCSWETIDKKVDAGIARIPLDGGSSPSTCKELPPLALREEEWQEIGRRMGWFAEKQTKFTREQLVFVVESILTGAMDTLQGVLPTAGSESYTPEWRRAVYLACGSVITSTGGSLSIFAAKLLNEGARVDALDAAGDFSGRVYRLVEESWKDDGQAVRNKVKELNGNYNVKDVFPNYPDCRVLAEEFVGKLFGDYLK